MVNGYVVIANIHSKRKERERERDTMENEIVSLLFC